MNYFEEEDRLYEFSVLSEAQGDNYAVECFDLTADGAAARPGLSRRSAVAADDSAAVTRTHPPADL